MKHKTIVRLVVKLLGVYLIALALPQALSQIANLAINSMYNGTSMSIYGPNGNWTWMIPSTLYWGTQIAVGAYLLFGGGFIVNRIVPSNRTYCPDCGYPLHHPVRNNCPECGVNLPHNIARSGAAVPARTAASRHDILEQ